MDTIILSKSPRIILSGGFDPIHSGHIKMIQDARMMGFHVIIVLNSDEWLLRKKGFFFQTFEERKLILNSLTHVHCVVPAIDQDDTVLGSLMELRPEAFGNGGDRTCDTTPEKEWCEQNGVEMVYGLGGNHKSNSSSTISTKAKVERKWGHYSLLFFTPTCKLKTLTVYPNHTLSYQKHLLRSEMWYVVSGEGILTLEGEQVYMSEGMVVNIPIGKWHGVTNFFTKELVIIEIQSGIKVIESDIERRATDAN